MKLQKKFSLFREASMPCTLAVIMASGLAFGVHSNAVAQQSTLDQIVSDGGVRLGYSNFKPTSYVGPNSEMTGAAPELAMAFFDSLGVEHVDGVVAEWSALIGGLQAKRFDMIAAAMQIQPRRCEQIAFGNPEIQYLQAFIVPAGNPHNLRSFADVAENEDARIGLLSGAGQIRYADTAGVPNARKILFPDYHRAFAAMRAGRVDVVAGGSVTVNSILQESNTDELEYVHLSEQPVDEDGVTAIAYAGMGFRKGDTELVQAWNDWLAEARESGELLEIIEPFGFTENDIPDAGITAEAICGEA